MGRGVRRRPMRLAEKLLQIRVGLGLSQGDLIVNLGLVDHINRGEISDFERDVREPDLLILKAYANAAGVLVDDLIDDSVALPKKLPAAKYRGKAKTRGAGATVTKVTLQLRIKSASGVASEETRARRNIERAHLKQYGMKKLEDDKYELTVSHQDDMDLDGQIYALLRAVKSEAKWRNCAIKVSVREKSGDRYW